MSLSALIASDALRARAGAVLAESLRLGLFIVSAGVMLAAAGTACFAVGG